MNRSSLRNNRLKLETAGKLLIVLDEFIDICPNFIKKHQRMLTCNRITKQCFVGLILLYGIFPTLILNVENILQKIVSPIERK